MISSVVEHEDDAQTLPDTEYVRLATSPCQFKAKFLLGKKQLVAQDYYAANWILADELPLQL